MIHQAFPYAGDDEFLAASVPFLDQGVRDGDVVLCVTSARNVELLQAELPRADVHFAQSDSWYGHPQQTLAAAYYFIDEHARRGRGVRFLGEPLASGRADIAGEVGTVGERALAGLQGWLGYEALLNAALADYDAWMLCPYDRATLAEEVLAEIETCHPQIAGAATARVSESYRSPHVLLQEWSRSPFSDPPHLDHVQLVIEGTLPDTRQVLLAHAARAGLDRHAGEDFVYAVSEVITNAIEHASGLATLRVWTEDGQLVCEVGDQGNGISDLVPVLLPPNPLAARGRGLWFAQHMCQGLDVRTGANGTVVRLRSPRPSSHGQQPGSGPC